MTKFIAKAAFVVVVFANLLPCRAQIAPPVLTPPGGTYSRPVMVQMTASSTANIYYTTDGSAPTANSNLYSGPITVGAGTTTVQAIALDVSGASSAAASATYTVAPSTSTTQLKTSANPLILPGALTLTATVNPTAAGGAVPTGAINFASNTSTHLGTAPLKIVPSTQAWTGGATLGTPLANPAGLASVVLAKGAQPVLVSAQSPVIGAAALPNVALYKLSPGADTLNAYTYTNGNQTTTDAVVAGYFLQPASSSVQSFVVHEYYQYEVFDGSTTPTSTILNLNPPAVTSNSGCDCVPPDNEFLSVADFDNDGYSDLGVLIAAYNAGTAYYPAVAGVAINVGSSGGTLGAGGFNSLVTAPAPSTLASGAVFCPVAITTGKFLSAAGTQLAVLASTPQSTCANTANGPFSIYLFSYDGTTSTLNAIGTPLVLPDNNATRLAAADLNNDGISDLIIGESIAAAAAPSGAIMTALSAGDGTFKTASAPSAVPAAPTAFTTNDFNGDGNIDVAYTSSTGYSILMGDGTGNLSSRSDYSMGASPGPGGITSADLNGDGLADLAVVPGNPEINNSNVLIELNSASAQAVLALGGQALAAGTYSLTASFPGDSNFAAGTSAAVSEMVSQTIPVITWAGSGGTLEYGTPLSAAQLNAAANVPGSFTYTPGIGAILPPGKDTINAAFAPTDSFDYAPAAATLSITVGSPALASITPSSANVGSGNTTITVTGLGFVQGATVTDNGKALTTTYVDQHHLTAVIPSNLLTSPASDTILVVDPGNLTATGSATFSVTAASAVATVNASESTVTAGQQSMITLSVDPYPATITATATLTFSPAPPNTLQDPAVLFSNNETTETVTIPPSSTTSSTQFQFQAGSTAGTLTVTIHLALAGGQDITPSNVQPVTVTVPASAPAISSATLTRSGQSLQVAVIALSSTRDMNQATFHFTPVTGKSLKTTDMTVSLTSVFQTWYGSSNSDQYGTNFQYTQPFTLDGDATDIQSVSVTLTNSAGTSQAATAQ